MDDDKAEQILLREMGGAPMATPQRLRFTTGRREHFWVGNCVALGLASGFLEPLESTSIQLVINGIYRLIDHFPDRNFAGHNVSAYNRTMIDEFERVRDFIILHYCLTGRRDTEFWRYCATMEVPDTLQERIDVFRETARIIPKPFEIFTDLSWFYIFEGMGVVPAAFDPVSALPSTGDLSGVMDQVRKRVGQIVSAAPYHGRHVCRPTQGRQLMRYERLNVGFLLRLRAPSPPTLHGKNLSIACVSPPFTSAWSAGTLPTRQAMFAVPLAGVPLYDARHCVVNGRAATYAQACPQPRDQQATPSPPRAFTNHRSHKYRDLRCRAWSCSTW